MAKSFRIILISLLCAAMLVSAASCDKKSGSDAPGTTKAQTTAEIVTEAPKYEPESATDLWNKIDETMDAIESYKESTTIRSTYYFTGYKFNIELDGVLIDTDEEEYSFSSMNMVCEDLSVNETMESLEAYVGGKMYVSNKSSGYDQKLCAEMTYEEFSEATSISGVDDDVDLADCRVSEFKKNEDGDWVVTMSGYSGKTVKAFTKDMIDDEIDFGADILDMECTVTADEDLIPKTMEVKFIFDEDDLTVAPEMTMTAEFSDVGTATVDPALIVPEEYTLVDDLAILSLLKEGIEERSNAAAGKFVYETKTTFTLFGEDQEEIETDTVTYGRKNGAYYYGIEAKYADGTVLIDYSNGVQTVTYGDESENVRLTDEEAKASVDTLINAAGYDPNKISGVTKKSDTEYVLTVAEYDTATFNLTLAESGIELGTGTQEITVTMTEDSVSVIGNKVTAEGTYTYDGQSAPISMVWESAVTFEEMADGAQDA